MLQSVRSFAIAAFSVAALVSAASGASAQSFTHGTNNNPGSGISATATPSESSGGSNYSVQCYTTAVAYVVKCNKPQVPSKVSERDCYCHENRIKTADGSVVGKVRCGNFRTEDLISLKIVADNCDSIRKLPKVASN
ncbi:hypothetical protein [Oryzibacter oryziterrae]|uniref:hypothetical protein n=1 Tax=Oryzibacter oryziterrae TaxID=2766474 RepID=UPI001F1AA86D|nr:hypothetical protein [Oryzibacter oryziterrae]